RGAIGRERLRRRDRLIRMIDADVRRVEYTLRLGALDAMIRADAALIEEHDIHVLGQPLVEGGEIIVGDPDAAAAGPADHVEQDALAFLAGEADRELDLDGR